MKGTNLRIGRSAAALAALALLYAFAVAGGPDPVAASASGDVERELTQLERDYWAANESLDVKTMDRLLADTFFHTDIVGDTATKAELIEFLKQGGEGASSSFELEDLRLNVYGGDAAVMTFWLNVTGTAKKSGETVRNHMRVTSVWVRQDGRWQRVAEHYSRPLTAPTASAPPERRPSL
jgi:ketosteroid isomerase-like protein